MKTLYEIVFSRNYLEFTKPARQAGRNQQSLQTSLLKSVKESARKSSQHTQQIQCQGKPSVEATETKGS